MPMALQIVTFQIQTAVLSATRTFKQVAANDRFEPKADCQFMGLRVSLRIRGPYAAPSKTNCCAMEVKN